MWWEDCKRWRENGGQILRDEETKKWTRLRWWTGPCFDLTMMEVFYSNSVFVYLFCDKNARAMAYSCSELFSYLWNYFCCCEFPQTTSTAVSGSIRRRLHVSATHVAVVTSVDMNDVEMFHSSIEIELQGDVSLSERFGLAVIFCESSGTFYITKLIVSVSNRDTETLIITTNSPYIWQGKNPTSKRENLDNHTTPPQQHTATVGRKNSLLTWSRSS